MPTLTVLPGICKGAAEIESHPDKYVDTKRMDVNLKEVHVLVGALSDGGVLIPVQLEVKEYKPVGREKNKLYLTVTLKKAEAGIMPRARADAQPSIHSTPASTVNVADLIANVKDETGDLVKYLPDELLNQEQVEAKRKALERDAKRIGDMRYAYAVERGNTGKAEEMLRDRAEQNGYSAGEDWRMAHRAPNAESGTALPDADRAYGGDESIYKPVAELYYGEGRKYDGKAIAVFSKARNKPEELITVYRVVPNNIMDTRLRNGDWVSPTREYAVEHGERTFEDGYRIIKEDVPAKHLYVNGDSIHEFGYDNGSPAAGAECPRATGRQTIE